MTQSITLEHGYGFCIGKMEKLTRVFISSINSAAEMFSEDSPKASRPRVVFFGCDEGDRRNWLSELNSDGQAVEFQRWRSKIGRHKANLNSENERNRRLGIETRNNLRNQIRIAPMRGSNIQPDVLAGKIVEVEKWIRDTLGGVKSSAMPKSFSVIPRKEHPLDG